MSCGQTVGQRFEHSPTERRSTRARLHWCVFPFVAAALFPWWVPAGVDGGRRGGLKRSDPRAGGGEWGGGGGRRRRRKDCNLKWSGAGSAEKGGHILLEGVAGGVDRRHPGSGIMYAYVPFYSVKHVVVHYSSAFIWLEEWGDGIQVQVLGPNYQDLASGRQELPNHEFCFGGGGFGPAADRVLLLRGTTARFHCNILRRNTFPERGTDTAAEVLCCL